jgi:hypothetical protein
MNQPSTSKKPYMPKGVRRKDKHKLIASLRAGKPVPFCPSSTASVYRKRLGIKGDTKHPKHKEIIEALQRKEKHLWIQHEYECSRATVQRYNREIKQNG